MAEHTERDIPWVLDSRTASEEEPGYNRGSNSGKVAGTWDRTAVGIHRWPRSIMQGGDDSVRKGAAVLREKNCCTDTLDDRKMTMAPTGFATICAQEADEKVEEEVEEEPQCPILQPRQPRRAHAR